ncbi:hypothetical protein WA026_017362 [Henosepilachna vigintioctopunctata]|uniref:Uncharacterized protein n=1 Tax=Henosepilachna vigintioctopunctata TaxID=420089 RepID=A0AAW1VF55_9CUCU
MPITLYIAPESPPSRAVMMTCEAIGLDLEYKTIVLENADHLQPSFLKINPQHTVPTLVDENTVIWDSHAIMTYLVSKYAGNDSLYPKNLEQRALVDQRLHFDTGSLFVHLRLYIKKCFSGNREKSVEDHERQTVLDSYNLLEEFLHKSSYMAGNDLTIADFSIITSVTGLNMMVSIDAKLYPRLHIWIKKIESLPYYNKVNEIGLQNLEDFMRNISQDKK